VNVHSADGWEQLLLPELERQQKLGKEVWFRADAAFATPAPSRHTRSAVALFQSRSGRHFPTLKTRAIWSTQMRLVLRNLNLKDGKIDLVQNWLLLRINI